VGACGRLQQQTPSARLEARPLGLRTSDVWLPGLGAGQATPTGCTLSCSHLARGLPSLGRLGYLLCAGQTQRTQGAWVDACVRIIIIIIIDNIINKIINKFERNYYY